MKTLDLIDPSRSDINYKMFTFPDGQPHINMEPPKKFQAEITVISRISNPSDLFLLRCVEQVLRRWGVKQVHLKVSYLMGARMDRIMSIGEPFTLDVVMDILSYNFNTIEILDAHSDTAVSLGIGNIKLRDNSSFIGEVLRRLPMDTFKTLPFLVSPDEGATGKIELLAATFGLDMVYGSKVRDITTGALSAPMINEANLDGRPCIVVDDICDGGYTFVQLAKVLKEKNAGDLFLAVTHGIFSKGLSPLEDYTRIFTTNSYKEQEPHPKLTVISC